MTSYSFPNTLNVMGLFFHDELFRDELQESLADESGETLVATLLLHAYPDADESTVLELTQTFVSDLIVEASELVNTVEADKEILIKLHSLIAEDKALRKSFTLKEANTLIDSLRRGDVATLSLLDQITGSYLIVTALSID